MTYSALRRLVSGSTGGPSRKPAAPEWLLTRLPFELRQAIGDALTAAELLALRGINRHTGAAMAGVTHPSFRPGQRPAGPLAADCTLAAAVQRQQRASEHMVQGVVAHTEFILPPAPWPTHSGMGCGPNHDNLALTPSGQLLSVGRNGSAHCETLLTLGAHEAPPLILHSMWPPGPSPQRHLLVWQDDQQLSAWRIAADGRLQKYPFVGGPPQKRPVDAKGEVYRLGHKGNTALTCSHASAPYAFWRLDGQFFRYAHSHAPADAPPHTLLDGPGARRLISAALGIEARIGDDNALHCLNVATGRSRSTALPRSLLRPKPTLLALSPDGTHVALQWWPVHYSTGLACADFAVYRLDQGVQGSLRFICSYTGEANRPAQAPWWRAAGPGADWHLQLGGHKALERWDLPPQMSSIDLMFGLTGFGFASLLQAGVDGEQHTVDLLSLPYRPHALLCRSGHRAQAASRELHDPLAARLANALRKLPDAPSPAVRWTCEGLGFNFCSPGKDGQRVLHAFDFVIPPAAGSIVGVGQGAVNAVKPERCQPPPGYALLFAMADPKNKLPVCMLAAALVALRRGAVGLGNGEGLMGYFCAEMLVVTASYYALWIGFAAGIKRGRRAYAVAAPALRVDLTGPLAAATLEPARA